MHFSFSYSIVYMKPFSEIEFRSSNFAQQSVCKRAATNLSCNRKTIITNRAKVKLKEHRLPLLHKRFSRCAQLTTASQVWKEKKD
jgi:hypothetical protein